MTRSLLYRDEVRINDYISIRIPTVGEILEDEDRYYGLVSMMVATPYDMMVQLDDIGIDFTMIDDYDLFLLLFKGLMEEDTSLLFGDLDLKAFQPMVNLQNNLVVLRNRETGDVIDKGVYLAISDTVRKIHHLKKETRKAANDEAKAYLIERARKRQKRRMLKQDDSQLEELIVALVNTEQFNYTFDDVKGLTIYQFNESVQQVVKKIDFDNKMRGIYAGTISAKDLSQDDLTWLKHK